MESFHIFGTENQNYQTPYEFNSADLADIPCPDDNCADEESSPAGEDIELPLPPGISGDEFPIPLPPKQEPFQISVSSSPQSENKALDDSSSHVLVTESSCNIPDENQSQSDQKFEEKQVKSKPVEFFDDSKYSPSKADSDEENQDFINIKPKVLGKEQAKKRLMAFSLSKQPSSSLKKQNKAISSTKNKEKPPNPNKGSNVQEQFRATISAIEEEKKKMFQNMPSYLLLEMSELTKSHSSMSSSLQLLEKLKNERANSESKQTYIKDKDISKEKVRSKKNNDRSRSPQDTHCSNRKRRPSRSKQSRSRSRRSHSRSRRRSNSKEHSCRKYKEDKNSKSENNESLPRKKFENWKDFKAAGSVFESEQRLSKNRFDEVKLRRDEYRKRSRSPNERTDFKPIFNYLINDCSFKTSLQAKSADLSHSARVLFSGKIIKYTRTKPMLCWAENPNYATEFYMSRQMLLENCDENTSSILLYIMESKKGITSEKEDLLEKISSSRSWYPKKNYLVFDLFNAYDNSVDNESQLLTKLEIDRRKVEENQINKPENKKENNNGKQNAEKGAPFLDRSISLVNDSYLSDEEQVRKEDLKEVTAQIDLKLNSVTVRSKWDSDYEGENSEKESVSCIEKPKEKTKKKMEVEETISEPNEKLTTVTDLCQLKLDEPVEKRTLECLNLVYQIESPSLDASDVTTGNLVSEYEEFLKMVSVDSNGELNNGKENTFESEPKLEKFCDENSKTQSPKLGSTDWDQESDREAHSDNKKIPFKESQDDFTVLRESEKLSINLEKSKKKSTKKKTEQVLLKKKTILKKLSKTKKKTCSDSCSDDSTTDLRESASESDSNDSEHSKKKKKKKKLLKSKKKSKKDSSESDSDSAESKGKRKKSKKKKGANKKSKSSNDDDSDEVENSLSKQLDFKKRLIIKKLEEIDYINDKNSKKKEKDNRGKKKGKESSDESNCEKIIKSEKKKKTESKIDKKKFKLISKKGKILGKNKKLKKSISSCDSNTESSEESAKEKIKKLGKRKRNSSQSSENDEKRTKITPKSSKKSSKKIKRNKRISSSSCSEDSDSSSKSKKKLKKKESKVKTLNPDLSFKENVFDEFKIRNEERPIDNNKKLGKKAEEKNKKKKESDDWEASTSGEESGEENNTEKGSWDEDTSDIKSKTHESENFLSVLEKQGNIVLPGKDKAENNSSNTAEANNNQLASEALKTSLSNFSFNENSFCSFGQELSRDFFLTERNYSNYGNMIGCDNVRTAVIEPRPFQSVSKDSEAKKPAHSELYSPGYSDSELSEAEACQIQKANSNVENGPREDVYDPLNCESDGSAENEVELSSIPLPQVSDILLPGESRNVINISNTYSNSESSVLKDLKHKEADYSDNHQPSSPVKSSITINDFTPVEASKSLFNDEKDTPPRKQLMSVKGQQKLISKAASVFQDESDEENIEPSGEKKTVQNTQTSVDSKEKFSKESQRREGEKFSYVGKKDEPKKRKKRSRDKSIEKESRRRSRSREKTDNRKSYSKRSSSSSKKKKSRTPEFKRKKREIRSDSFEIEPLKSSVDSSELSRLEHPIPVLMGLDTSSEIFRSRSFASGNEFSHTSHTTDNLIHQSESFDIYPSEESTLRNRFYDKDRVFHEKTFVEKSRDGKNKKSRRKSRSRSYSPRKKPRSKSPERRESPGNRSPRRRSVSPKRRDKSPFSPRKRSPKRRSPDKRKKSVSRSPRKRKSSLSRRSRSLSPRKYRSPKYRDESPRRKDSPARIFNSDDRFSPKKDRDYSESYSVGLQNRIPVIGAKNEGVDLKLNSSILCSPYDGFSRLMPDSSVAESEIYNSFYEGDYTEEFGASCYPEEVGVNNLITVKSHDTEKISSPERLSLDQRIELELGVPVSVLQSQSDQYQISNQVGPSFQEMNQMNQSHFQNSYNCDNTNDSFYQNQNVQMNPDYNGQYFNGHQQQSLPNYGPFQQYPNSQPVQNSVLQVGNIVEVVPTIQHPPPMTSLCPKAPQIMQVGNVLQVLPLQKATPQSLPHSYGTTEDSTMLKTQKATAVVAPSSIVPTPDPETLLNPLIKAIQLEREKRKREKEKRKSEREARRKARQLRREAKLMSVNEKLKKSVQNEGLMLGQEVEDDELLDGLDVPSPPIPVEIITVSSPSALPPAGKGILITAGFMPKPPSEKKEVKFADGVCPGEGTSTSGDEDVASPPPKPKLPKEKRFKKKKTKVKKKVKVQIIRQIIQEEDEDEDDLSPPPPPPGDPPPVFFARYPFAGDAQFPVYQTQTTTTTTLTTVQYPVQSFE